MQEGVRDLVSVIIPVYNRAGLLREAVASVLAQSHAFYEILVVDDGSTDDTQQAAQALVDAHAGRIFVHRQANAGPGAARNLALRHARGEFVQFLDSDDLLQAGKFEAQIRAMRRDPQAALAYGRTMRIDVASGRSREWERTGEAIEQIFPDFLMKRGWDTNSPLWRRSARERVGDFMEVRSLEDWEHDLRAGIEGLRPVRVEEHVATVRDHGGDRASGMKSGFTARMVADHFLAHRSIWFLMRSRMLVDWRYLEGFSRKLFWIARMCGEHGLVAEAEEALAIAEEMVATRRYPWEMRRFRALKSLVGWRRAVALGEAVRRPFRSGAG